MPRSALHGTSYGAAASPTACSFLTREAADDAATDWRNAGDGCNLLRTPWEAGQQGSSPSYDPAAPYGVYEEGASYDYELMVRHPRLPQVRPSLVNAITVLEVLILLLLKGRPSPAPDPSPGHKPLQIIQGWAAVGMAAGRPSTGNLTETKHALPCIKHGEQRRP